MSTGRVSAGKLRDCFDMSLGGSPPYATTKQVTGLAVPACRPCPGSITPVGPILITSPAEQSSRVRWRFPLTTVPSSAPPNSNPGLITFGAAGLLWACGPTQRVVLQWVQLIVTWTISLVLCSPRPAASAEAIIAHLCANRAWGTTTSNHLRLSVFPCHKMPRQHLTPNACLVCRKKRTKVTEHLLPHFRGLSHTSLCRQYHWQTSISVMGRYHVADAGQGARSAPTRIRNGGPKTTCDPKSKGWGQSSGKARQLSKHLLTTSRTSGK